MFKGTYPFEKTHFDLIPIKEPFNSDFWILHFYCSYSGYHVVFTSPTKREEELVKMTETFIKLTQAWGYTIREFRSDGERSLSEKWKELIRMEGITFHSSPPHTQEQKQIK